MDPMFEICYRVAQRITQRYRNQLPPGVELYAFGGGGSTSAADSNYSRYGGSQNLTYQNPEVRPANWGASNPFWSDMAKQTASSFSPFRMPTGTDYGDTLGGKRDAYFHSIFDNAPSAPNTIPGSDIFDGLVNLDPHGYHGHTQLQTQTELDPFNLDWATQSNPRYDDAVDRALLRVNSGPGAVRGADGRNALIQADAINQLSLNRADELRRQQLAEASMQNQASQMMEAMESGRRAQQLSAQNQQNAQLRGTEGQALQAAGSGLDRWAGMAPQLYGLAQALFGEGMSESFEDMTGFGTQSGSTGSWSVNLCCFIFLEALNGELPPVVRRARDVMGTRRTKLGYRRMSSWLVPLMKRNSIVKHLVNLLMVKPLIKYGEGYFATENATRWWRCYAPFRHFWFALWNRV